MPIASGLPRKLVTLGGPEYGTAGVDNDLVHATPVSSQVFDHTAHASRHLGARGVRR